MSRIYPKLLLTTINIPSAICALSPRIFLSPNRFFSIACLLPPHMKEWNCLTTTFIQSTKQNPLFLSHSISLHLHLSHRSNEISCCEEDIFTIFSSLDTSKAMGIDNIGQKLLKFSAIFFLTNHSAPPEM